eukprot:15093024-Heterocapsa_arctica.AAC.1
MDRRGHGVVDDARAGAGRLGAFLGHGGLLHESAEAAGLLDEGGVRRRVVAAEDGERLLHAAEAELQ